VRRAGLSALFLLLILGQAVHSIEEYAFRLYDVLLPARAVSAAFGLPPSLGFAIANTLFVLFGLWCWVARVRPQRPGARGLAWFWALIEIGNGLAHLVLAVAAGGYFPGLWTTPLLLALGLWLALRLARSSKGVTASSNVISRGPQSR
jgi:hypothetical protein